MVLFGIWCYRTLVFVCTGILSCLGSIALPEEVPTSAANLLYTILTINQHIYIWLENFCSEWIDNEKRQYLVKPKLQTMSWVILWHSVYAQLLLVLLRYIVNDNLSPQSWITATVSDSKHLKAPQCNYLPTCQSITALDKPARLIIRSLFGLKNTETAMLSKQCPYHMSQNIFVCIDFSVTANWKFICVVVLVCFYYKAQAGVFVSVFVCFIRLVSNIDRALLIRLKMSR